MNTLQDLTDYLSPVEPSYLNEDLEFNDGQYGKHIQVFENDFPDLSTVDLVILGVGDMRGANPLAAPSNGPDLVRQAFYRMHCWHEDIRVADIGNLKAGATLADTIAAMKITLTELIQAGKTALIIGGSHDLTLGQYETHKAIQQVVEAVCVDAFIDLKGDSTRRDENFLMDMLTGEPNYIRHYSHIGFQSYLVHPRLLETLDKLRFDCYRVGKVRETPEEMEPVIRSSEILSFDIQAIQHGFAPAHQASPNGFTGEEACLISQYAGLSSSLKSFGIYGYQPEQDPQGMTALQIAQMIWYFIEGLYRKKMEAPFEETQSFNEYHTLLAEVDTRFLQSKRTGRWWMQMPDGQLVPCSETDYIKAGNNDIPERWLRIQERR
jgi:arginase family enzyme